MGQRVGSHSLLQQRLFYSFTRRSRVSASKQTRVTATFGRPAHIVTTRYRYPPVLTTTDSHGSALLTLSFFDSLMAQAFRTSIIEYSPSSSPAFLVVSVPRSLTPLERLSRRLRKSRRKHSRDEVQCTFSTPATRKMLTNMPCPHEAVHLPLCADIPSSPPSSLLQRIGDSYTSTDRGMRGLSALPYPSSTNSSLSSSMSMLRAASSSSRTPRQHHATRPRTPPQ